MRQRSNAYMAQKKNDTGEEFMRAIGIEAGIDPAVGGGGADEISRRRMLTAAMILVIITISTFGTNVRGKPLDAMQGQGVRTAARRRI
jgi:hypothetical protein